MQGKHDCRKKNFEKDEVSSDFESLIRVGEFPILTRKQYNVRRGWLKGDLWNY